MQSVHYEQRAVRNNSLICLVVGIWLAVSPLILQYTSTASRNDQLIVGIIVVILSLMRYIWPQVRFIAWASGLCGIWLILSPFLLGLGRTVAYWNSLVAGVIVAVVALWNSSLYTEHHYHSSLPDT